MVDKMQIQVWLAERLGSELKIAASAVDPHKPFPEYGIDSASAVGVVADLEDFLRRPLDPNLFYVYPTIDELADHLASERQAEDVGRAARSA